MSDQPAYTIDDAALAIYALHGIIRVLDWIDDGFLDDKASANQIKEARTRLLLAGRTICEQAAERF